MLSSKESGSEGGSYGGAYSSGNSQNNSYNSAPSYSQTAPAAEEKTYTNEVTNLDSNDLDDIPF